MEIIQYSEEHRIFREAVRRFFEKEVIPYVDEWEEAGIVPKSVWRKMGEQGFLCMQVPEEYGGLGADFLYSVILSEELVKTNHTGLAAPLHSDVIVPYITSFASEELKKKYLPKCVSGEIITAFGKPISKFQNTQFKLVEMATEVKLGRTFLDKLIVDHMEGKNIVVEVSMAKYWTTEMAMRVADRCVQLHGGYGYCEEYPMARAWRDTRVLSIFAGTNEIMKTIAAKFMGL
ncbi:MAG TPA: hypothetical protein ENH37_13495 [Deltaproteobacteria bacterium]|nr:hypothetical protein [Deltaproteobacteria bacterium]